MKLFALIGTIVAISFGAFAENNPSEANQKWLQIVEQKVSSGQTEVSTPSPERAELLKNWAANQGYTVQVSKDGDNYRLALAKSPTAVAQR